MYLSFSWPLLVHDIFNYGMPIFFYVSPTNQMIDLLAPVLLLWKSSKSLIQKQALREEHLVSVPGHGACHHP